MQCPVCKKTMSCKIARDVEMNVCPYCSGAFISGRDIQTIFGIEMTVKRFLQCTKCNSMMSTKIIGGVEVDVCPSCGMVWFDKSELAKLWFARSVGNTKSKQ